MSLNKNQDQSQELADYALIKSVVHLAKTDIPSFRHIARHASANKILENIALINTLAENNGIGSLIEPSDVSELIDSAIENRITENIVKINKLVKALTAGYGGAGAPGNLTYGSVIQAEAIDPSFKYVSCYHCGKNQPYLKHQVKCRNCEKSLSFETLEPKIKSQK